MALASEYRDVLRLIVGKGLLLTSAGVLIGIPPRLLSSAAYGTAFGVTPNDPATFVAVSFACPVSLAAICTARRAAQMILSWPCATSDSSHPVRSAAVAETTPAMQRTALS